MKIYFILLFYLLFIHSIKEDITDPIHFQSKIYIYI